MAMDKRRAQARSSSGRGEGGKGGEERGREESWKRGGKGRMRRRVRKCAQWKHAPGLWIMRTLDLGGGVGVRKQGAAKKRMPMGFIALVPALSV